MCWAWGLFQGSVPNDTSRAMPSPAIPRILHVEQGMTLLCSAFVLPHKAFHNAFIHQGFFLVPEHDLSHVLPVYHIL